jgi:hypothetical protein
MYFKERGMQNGQGVEINSGIATIWKKLKKSEK